LEHKAAAEPLLLMLLIVGLDGATWELIDPMIAQGQLPNLARLQRTGWSGPLASTIPPATFSAWSTFMTGVNPGQHGVFDFTRRVFGTYEVEFVNATFRRVPSIWKYLSAAGRRICVLGLPGTYPPEAVNGCMISGFDTPVTTRADASFIEPPALAPLVMRSGGFPFADFQEFRVGANWYHKALNRLLRGIEIKTGLAQTLLASAEWDCLLLLFGESDTVAHHFWKFHDPRSPRFDARGAADFGDGIRRVYNALDIAIGRLIEAVPHATVLVVSDHGFGGAGDKALYLNNWLKEHRFQRPAPRRRSLAAALKRIALRGIPTVVQARAFRMNGGRWAGRLESHARFAGVDWRSTRAFSEELNYFPSIWLNLKGREPLGTVEPGDYEGVRDDICAAAQAWRDPEHGAPVVRRAWRREELYHGASVQYAPDVVLELNLDRGYSYTCLPSAGAQTSQSVRRLDPSEWTGGKLAGMSGSHRVEGVFLLNNGPILGPRRVIGAHIADMAPTILSLCGVQVPAGLDGRAVISGRGMADRIGSLAVAADEHAYTQTENEEVAARLAALGYLQ
jgi:predicted AlkP superfamily phosphohydrolase/phosphomutase